MSDKQYAENLSGGESGGASEPSDSFEEVATGLIDADGNMIFKRTFTGTGWDKILDSSLTSSIIRVMSSKGWVKKNDIYFPIPFYSTNGYKAFVNVSNNGLKLENGADVDQGYYVTVYYTYVPVPRATSRKKNVTE